MNHSHYLSLVTTGPGSQNGTFDLLELIRQFDQTHWRQFIGDIVNDHANAYMILSPDKGVDLLTSLAVLLGRMGESTKELASTALSGVITDMLPNPQSNLERCKNAISLALYMPSIQLSEQLQNFAIDPALPRPLLNIAAKFLASDDSPKTQVFWNELDIKKFPHLAWAMILGLRKTDPLRAIQKLNGLFNPIEQADMLESPLRLAFRMLLPKRTDRERLFDALNLAPDWLAEIHDSVLKFREFKGIRQEYIRYQSGEVGQSKSWDEYVYRVLEREKVEYCYHKYLSGNPILPDYLLVFLRSLASAVLSEAADDAQKEITLDRLPLSKNNTLVDNTIYFNPPLVGIAFAGPTRKNRADLVKMGTIRYFGVVMSSELGNDIRGRIVGSDSKDQRPQYVPASHLTNLEPENWPKYSVGTLTELYHLIGKNYKFVRLLVLDGTTLDEELERITKGYRYYDIDEDEYGASRPLRQIENLVKSGLERSAYIAVLDWKFAAELHSRLSTQTALFLCQYDSPLGVGILTPPNDDYFSRKIFECVKESMWIDGQWNYSFREHAKQCLIELSENGIEIVPSTRDIVNSQGHSDEIG